jgi:hypothetical protein
MKPKHVIALFLITALVLLLEFGLMKYEKMEDQVTTLTAQTQEQAPEVIQPSTEFYKTDFIIARECLEADDHGRLIRYCDNNQLDYEALMRAVVAEGPRP